MEITKFLGDVNNISALSTKPNSIDGLTGPQLQAKWDKAGNDIKNYINNTLTTEIEDKIEILEDNTGTKTDTYSASATYAINDIVIHNNKLYKCTTAITVAEEFNPAKWLQVSLLDEINRAKKLNGQEFIIVTIATGKTMSLNYKIPFDVVSRNTSSGKLTLSSGNVVIGDGVKKVRVSGCIFNEVQVINAGTYSASSTQKNGVLISTHIINLATQFCTNNCLPRIVDVTKNDTITLNVDCNGNSIARAGVVDTWLLVEIIE